MSNTTDMSDDPTPRAVVLVDQLHTLLDELQSVDLSPCTDAQLIDLAAATEQAIPRLTYAGDRQIVEAAARDLPRKTGHRSIVTFMNQHLRIVEPTRRRKQMKATATFTGLTGEPLTPACPALAEAFARGEVGATHIRAVLDTLDEIPDALDHDLKVAAERHLSELAVEHTPTDINALGARLLAHLDPDGTLTDDTDRKRRRNVFLTRQNADGTAKLCGTLTPELQAKLSAFFAVAAAPGMNNPDDPDSPAGSAADADPARLDDAAGRDGRTPAMRQHDALDALLTTALDNGVLGTSHRGLPVQLIIKTDLAELKREAGVATTATGTLIPIRDVLDMAADIQPYLAVFKDATTVPLYFGRAKRLATRDQRLASFARPDGECCSAPGCDQPAAHCEMHHARNDWADGGLTDITDLTPACPRHNRMVGTQPGQFTTRIIDHGPDEGRCAWQLNSHPDAPANPNHINRRPDTATRFTEHLDDVRNEVFGNDDDPTVDDDASAAGNETVETGAPPALYTERVIDYRPPPPTPSEKPRHITEYTRDAYTSRAETRLEQLLAG